MYSAAGDWARRPGQARWVMDSAWYRRLRAASEITRGERADPDAASACPHDTLFGLPLSVRDGGGEPHLEMTGEPASDQLDALIDRVQRDPRDVALEIARCILAPPPLAEIPASAMLAVAPAPGKTPEEWRHAALGAWIAHPHAAGAVHAEEMTAAQLRALLAARDHGASKLCEYSTIASSLRTAPRLS